MQEKTSTSEMELTTFIAKAPKNMAFNALDADQNHRITLGEARKDKSLTKRFVESDVNHDGVITVDEFTKFSSNDEKE